MKRTVGDYLFLTLSVFGSLASIFAYVEYIGPKLNDQGVAGVIFLGILCFLYFGYLLFLIAKYRKRIRYVEIFEDLNLSFSKIHSDDRKGLQNTEGIINSLSELCNGLSNCFTKINGHHIGVCIKCKYLETGDNQRLIVKTLARDIKSKAKGRKTGEADKKHLINKNTAFKCIYYDYTNINIPYFYGTYLPYGRNYENTSLPKVWPPKKTIWAIDCLIFLIRHWIWPLPYRSTLIVPIIPLIADEHNEFSLRGFLCIDSPRNNAFYRHPDIDILRGVADGIYKQIDKLYQIEKADIYQQSSIKSVKSN